MQCVQILTLQNLQRDLRKFASKKKARILQRFFKTGPGDYGQGDIFIGVVVPDIRRLVKRYQGLNSSDTITLLKSSIHEERLTALLILVGQFENGNERSRHEIFSLYLKHTKYINNWDLVDLTAGRIVGAFLKDKSRKILYKLAKSRVLWERRIAIISTSHFIRHNQFQDTVRIARLLLYDEHDLIHKAVGWMLREVGKRHQVTEEYFLKNYCTKMPRTMLRYAIERFPKSKQKAYLSGLAR